MDYLKSLFQEQPFHNSIRRGRIQKEKELCETEVEWRSCDDVDIVTFNERGCIGEISLSQMYPFHQPQIKFSLEDDFYTVANYEDTNDYDYYFKTLKWTPSLTINQIIKNCKDFMGKKLIIKKPYSLDPYSDACCKLKNTGGVGLVVAFLLLMITLINLLITFTDYSNYQQIMFKTISLNYNSWYRSFDSLQIAPLKAYFFYFIALIVSLIDQNSIFVNDKSLNLPFYHYLNVCINMTCFYVPVYLILKDKHIKLNKNIQYGILFYLLTCPTIIGVWNITESLLIVAAAFLQQNIWFGSVMFLVLVNYEPQMLFYSPIAVIFVIGQLCQYHGVISAKTIKPNFKTIHRVFIEGGLIVAVLLILQTFILLPFILNSSVGSVLNSLVLLNHNSNLFNNPLVAFAAPFAFIAFLIPSLILAFLSEKYLSLSFLATTAYLLLFNITTEIRIQTFSVLLILNFKYMQILINNITFALPQPNKFYQLLYFVFGELFTRRNHQVIKQEEQNKLDKLLKILSAVQNIFKQVQVLILFMRVEYFVYFGVLILGLKTTYEKIVKILRKRKVD